MNRQIHTPMDNNAMASYFRYFLLVILFSFLSHCNIDQDSEADLEFTALQGLLNGNAAVFFVGEIDMEKTADCGRATVSNTTGTTGGQNPNSGTGSFSARNTTNNNQQNQLFSIIGTYNFKNTFETLNIRFNYDRRQVRGPLNTQQGFVLTGGFFGNTVTGRQGTVEWGQTGINLIANQSNQQLQFMEIKLDLTGTYVPGAGSSVPPNQCFTQDGVNCTSVQTNTQCFTQDNRTCLGDTAASENATQILIRGTIRCNAPGII